MTNKPLAINIIRDSREKTGYFTFASYNAKVTIGGLKTGDYSIIGYNDKITIDRKKTSGELQMCLGKDWVRFKKELERMTEFEEAYIICEFPEEYIDIFPMMSEIPRRRWKYLKIKSPFIKKRLHEIREQFPDIKIIFSKDHYDAEQKTYNILKKYNDNQINSKK